MNSHRLARLLTGLVGLCFVLAGAAVAFRWTLIPLELDSRVVGIGWIDGTTVHLQTLDLDDGRTITVDHEIIRRAGGEKALLGAVLQKHRLEWQVAIDGRRVPLSIPLDGWLTVAALSIPIAMGWRLRRSR